MPAAWARCIGRATPSSNRDVAIKVLPAAFASDPDRLARFEREAQAVAALSHPNILAIHDFGTAGRHAVTPSWSCSRAKRFATAPDRRRRCRREGGRFRVPDRPRSCRRARERHRSPRPQAGERLRHRATVTSRSSTSGSPGTSVPTAGVATRPSRVGTEPGAGDGHGRLHVAGAGARRSRSITAPTSSRSARVLYEMLTGRRAFSRDTAAETMTAILRDDPPELSRLRQRHSARARSADPALPREAAGGSVPVGARSGVRVSSIPIRAVPAASKRPTRAASATRCSGSPAAVRRCRVSCADAGRTSPATSAEWQRRDFTHVTTTVGQPNRGRILAPDGEIVGLRERGERQHGHLRSAHRRPQCDESDEGFTGRRLSAGVLA